MTPTQLLQFFVALFPAFQRQWNDEENNMNRNGEDFTAHGVCAEFSAFFVAHHSAGDRSTVARLFQRVEELIVSDPEDRDAVVNAVCTCFLENIAQLPAGENSLPLMGPETLKFFAQWHAER